MRAGASVDVVVAETGWPLDKVTRYAEPVLGERAHVANLARASEIRRGGPSVSLDESVRLVLGLSDDDTSATWDASRREDGKWIITVKVAGEQATWGFDLVGNSVHPLDDIARAYMGITPPSDPIEDALGLLADTPVVRANAEVEELTVEAERPRLVAVPALDEGPRAEDEPDDVQDEQPIDAPSLSTSAHETIVIASAEQPTVPKPRKPRPKKGRASVPSWDEILFGTGQADE